MTPASARRRRSPGQPSVKAVNAVLSVRPTASRFRWISPARSVPALATALKNWRPPEVVSTLPTRTSRCRSPSSPRRRHTAREQPFDVLIQYPQHPRAGERVVVVRRLHHGGNVHFVIEQPAGTRRLF